MKSSSLLYIPICVQGKFLNAVVDTASEVTLISDKVYQGLQPQPQVVRNFLLYAAGRNMKMRGYEIKPVEVKLGNYETKESIYVAPIEDDMLLGLDFLRKHHADISLSSDALHIGGQTMPFDSGEVSRELKIARVKVKRKVKVPALSAIKVSCSLDQPMEEYYTESEVNHLMVPRTVQNGKTPPIMVFFNCSDKAVKLSRGQIVGLAYEFSSVLDDNEQSASQTGMSVNQVKVDSGEIPEHVQDLFERSKQDLTPDEQIELKRLLVNNADAFSTHDLDLGSFDAIEHTVDTGDAKPVKQRLRRTPVCFEGEEEKHLDKMLKAGVIEPSISEWASPPVLIRKRDGSVRWCVDYRGLNKVTKKEIFPLPIVEQCLDALYGNMWFSKLDATCGYWQVKIKDEDKCKTAFITKYGLYQFTRMSFGLCNAPSTFTRVMNLVLHGLHWRTVLAFLDDVLVLGRNFGDHLKNLSQVLERFRIHNIKLKPKKCELFRTEVEYLGRTVGREGMRVGEGFLETMEAWPVPTCTKDVEKFCGFANYHRSFIKDFANIALPLYRVTGKKPFQWGPEQAQAFEILKKALTSAPVLTIPNMDGKFILDTDASNEAIGAELLQVQDGEERCIAYCSMALTPEQKRYCTTRKELLAVIRFTRHFRHYLLGREFEIRTDHSSLQWLLNFKNLNGQLARWLEELSQYWMTIKHRPGAAHDNADCLSRIPHNVECDAFEHGVGLENLPCGGCKYCTRMQENWGSFISQVDEAVSLVSKGKQENPKVKVSMARTEKGNEETGFWADGYSRESIKKAQSEDKELMFLVQWLKTQEVPSERDLFLSSPATKHMWLNRTMFYLDNEGILCKKLETQFGNSVLVLPRLLTKEALQLCHDIPAAGHQGHDRTLNRCKVKYYWHGMSDDVKRYVTGCPTCNRNKKASKKAKGHLTLFHAGSPMERVHLDFLGPLTKTKRGNSNILVMVDQFTKWVECVALPNQTAEETARAAVNEFFSRFGFPFQIFTDRGTNFESNLFQHICDRLQIHKARTTPYRPSSNGQCERVNRTLMDAVRCFASRIPTMWDEYLPQLAGALRSAVNRNTGFTANMLMLGREVNVPADLVFPSPEQEKQDVNEFVGQLVDHIQKAHEAARDKLKTTQTHMKRDYDLRANAKQYEVGSVVYVLDDHPVPGKCKKLRPVWKGPAIVTRKLSDYVYEIKLRQKLVTMHHDRMKLCSDRQLPKWVQKHRENPTSALLQNDVFCICRGPDKGDFMIQCDECREWFHGDCVKVTEAEAAMIDVYLCINCIN